MAVTTPFVVAATVGAVNKPLLEMLPTDADHVTDVSVVFATVALNCSVPNDGTVDVVGEMEIDMGEVEFEFGFPLLTPAQDRHRAVRQRIVDTSKTAIRAWKLPPL